MSQPMPAANLTPEHLMTLYRVSMWINSTLDFDTALNNVMDAIMEVTKAQRGFLMLLDEAENTLRVLVARGIDGSDIESEGYSTTIVGRVVETRETLLTNNAEFDSRFSAGHSIIMRGLRAILCAPMLVAERLIGVVYVDTSMKAGLFRPDDMALLNAVSGLAARAIENARLYLVAREKGRLEHELHMASQIQRSLLPQQMPVTTAYEIAPHWEAAREVAGDFYDAFELGGGAFGTVIADVSDKGAPAALFMAVTRTLMRSHAKAGLSPSETVRRTNDLLVSDAEDSGMFVTVYYSHFQPDGYVTHVNAGHNPPVLCRANGQVSFLGTGGRALGWFPNNPVAESDMKLNPGDVIVYYTDGLTDAENSSGEPFGEARLAQSVKRHASKDAAAIRAGILEDVFAHCDGTAPFDDLTMLIVKYRG
ncbi:MAG: GAF domain-containing SpoIIE family protein phosphatase [Anaerolineae bacterium]